MLVVGVDPGNKGALAIYDSAAATPWAIWDIPTWNQQIGRGKRTRIRMDAVEILNRMYMLKDMGVALMIIEEVGPRKHNAGMFAFGYGYGLLVMATYAARIPLEPARPQVWKKIMGVAATKNTDQKSAEAVLRKRAHELWPDHQELFVGPRGGIKYDRIEALLIAKFGADHLLGATSANAESRLLEKVYDR